MGICRGRLRLRGRCSHVSQVECWRCVEAWLLLLVPGGAVFVGVVAGVAGAQLLAVRLEPAHAHQLVPGHALQHVLTSDTGITGIPDNELSSEDTFSVLATRLLFAEGI